MPRLHKGFVLFRLLDWERLVYLYKLGTVIVFILDGLPDGLALLRLATESVVGTRRSFALAVV